MQIESYVMIAANRGVVGRIFLHLVRSHIHRLHILPLKSALRAISSEIMLQLTGTQHIAAFGAVTRSARFLVVDAEIGIIGEKIEVIAESFEDRTG